MVPIQPRHQLARRTGSLRCDVAFGSRLCENVREQRTRRIVFYFFFFRRLQPVLFFP